MKFSQLLPIWSQKLMASEGIADPWNASGLYTAACPSLGGNGEDINGEVVNC
jgi:hypothetical protein